MRSVSCTSQLRQQFAPHISEPVPGGAHESIPRESGAAVSGRNADAFRFAWQDQIFIFIFIFAQTSIEKVQSPGMPRPPSMPPTVDCI